MYRLGLAVSIVMVASGCETNTIGLIEAQRFGDLSLGEPPRAPLAASVAEVCGDVDPSGAVDDWLLRGPYLQRVTAAGARIMWTSPVGIEQVVTVTDGSGGVVFTGAAAVEETTYLEDAEQKFVDVVGLDAGTTYCYALHQSGQVAKGRVGFTTAPAPGSPIRAVTLGDLGVGDIDQIAVRDQLREFDYQLGLINGDVGYENGSLHDFEENFFPVYGDLIKQVPFFTASGNHDYRCDDAGPFREVFAMPENGGSDGFERWYSFDWGDLHVVVLDSERISDVQTSWLEEDLAGNELPWTVAVLHRPPHSSGSHGGSDSAVEKWVPLFEQYAVALVLSGHDHNYERTNVVDGVTYVVAGAGGRGTRSVGDSWFTAFAEQVSHFVYLEVDGTQLRGWAIDGTGTVFDTFAIERP